jgi:O-antigen/teichoic acid export membrane protein
MIPLTQNVGIEIQRAENRHKFRSIAYLIMAVFNLLLSIVLCQRYGAIGCAVGTCASFLLANGLMINLYYHRKCNINIVTYWRNFFRMSTGLVLPAITGTVILLRVPTDTIGRFALSVAAYTGIYWGSMWFVAMNEKEKQLIRSFAGKLRRRA